MNVRMPDGVLLRDVPDGTPKAAIMAKYLAGQKKNQPEEEEPPLRPPESLPPGIQGTEPPPAIDWHAALSKAGDDASEAARGFARPFQQIGRAIMNEAKSGREMLGEAFQPRIGYEGPGDLALDIATRAQRAGIGAARMAMPAIGGYSQALFDEPVTRATGSEIAGDIAGIAAPFAALGASKLKALEELIKKAPGVAQLVIAELGGDAPAVPSLLNAAERGEKTSFSGAAAGARAQPGSIDELADRFGKHPFGEGEVPPTMKATPTPEPVAAVSKGSIDFDALIGETFTISTKERLKYAQRADEMGFLISRGERGGNKFIQQLETGGENLPGGSHQPQRDHNLGVLNVMATTRAGKPAAEISSEWISQRADEFGTQLNELVSRTGQVPMERFKKLAEKHMPDPVQRKARSEIKVTLDTLDDDFYGGTITPENYQVIRSSLGAQAEAAGNNPSLQRTYGKLQESLDHAMTVSAKDGALRKSWRDWRQQYKDFKIIEESVDKGNGLLNPATFARKVEQNYRGSFKRSSIGTNDMIDLAVILRTFKNQIPTSGTAERTAATSHLQQAGRIMTGAASVGVGDLTGVAATYALAKAFKKYSFTKPKSKAKP